MSQCLWRYLFQNTLEVCERSIPIMQLFVDDVPQGFNRSFKEFGSRGVLFFSLSLLVVLSASRRAAILTSVTFSRR